MTMHDVMDARYMLDNNGDGEWLLLVCACMAVSSEGCVIGCRDLHQEGDQTIGSTSHHPQENRIEGQCREY